MKCNRCQKELTKEDGDWEMILEKLKELGVAFNIKLECPECFKLTLEENHEIQK